MRHILLAVLLIPFSTAAGSTQATLSSDRAFGRLKALVGTWESIETATSRRGTIEYTLTGGGHVLLEVHKGGMATAYHLDKGTLMLTHYCGAGNQPRMRVKTIDDRHVAFEMYDITNLSSPDAYRTTSLDVVFHDDGTVDLAYLGQSGRESRTQTFKLLRRASSR